jgi:hypothetical protein
MRITFLIACISIVCVLFLTSCKEDSPEILTKEKLSGYIQKGPFLNGTSISVSELRTDLSQTGKSFSSQIKDNQGTFELSNVQLSTPYVELKADGFYFNEVTGETSKSQITLFALADVTNLSTLNVNVLSTLEKGRIENLVASGLSFTDAKKKALEEILAIFSLSKSDMKSSELLDINKSGDDNAILLAISVILQGYRSEAELSELLANLSGDISTDGKLDSETLGTALISHAKYLNPAKIRENLAKRYDDIGSTSQIPEFEKYITKFIENTSFNAIDLISYPESVDGVLNVLNEKNTSFISYRTDFGRYYSFSASTFKGMSLKIKLEYVAGGDSTYGYWAYAMESDTNWKITNYDNKTHVQNFEVIDSGKSCIRKLYFMSGLNTKIRVNYFENNNLVATRSRIITVN